jgi:hypothetical protein
MFLELQEFVGRVSTRVTRRGGQCLRDWKHSSVRAVSSTTRSLTHHLRNALTTRTPKPKVGNKVI